jgi:pantoate--beta-alanine ligase
MRLTIRERKLAPLIYQVLLSVKEKAGAVSIEELKAMSAGKFAEHPEFSPEYFEILDPETFLPLESLKTRKMAIACTAVFLGDVRLIDNMELFI